MRRLLPFAVAALVVLGAVLAVPLLAAAPEDSPRLGAALSAEDRATLGAPAVVRGAEPPPVDPAVDLRDPAAVARAYLVAAYRVSSTDAGHTHLRAAAYAVPGSPPATVGVLVLDPPPPGSQRRAAVASLELVAADPGGRRRAYLATVVTATGPSGVAATDELTAHVVLARQPDGRWLVAADSTENPDLT